MNTELTRLRSARHHARAPLRSVLASYVLVLVTGAVGCSGSEDPDVLASGAASSSGDTSPGASSGSSGQASSSGTSGSSGSSGTPADCTRESEPNDSPGQANALAPLLCGTVGAGDAKDFLTFTLAPTTQTMSLRFEGRVRLRVSIDGKEQATLTPDSGGAVPFVKGATYMIEIDSIAGGGRSVDWLVEVVER